MWQYNISLFDLLCEKHQWLLQRYLHRHLLFWRDPILLQRNVLGVLRR